MQDKQLDNAIVDPRSYADEATYHGLFGRLRRDDPVHWAEPDGFRPFWALSKYADIIEVERQNRRFLSARRSGCFRQRIAQHSTLSPAICRCAPSSRWTNRIIAPTAA